MPCAVTAVRSARPDIKQKKIISRILLICNCARIHFVRKLTMKSSLHANITIIPIIISIIRSLLSVINKSLLQIPFYSLNVEISSVFFFSRIFFYRSIASVFIAWRLLLLLHVQVLSENWGVCTISKRQFFFFFVFIVMPTSPIENILVVHFSYCYFFVHL